MMMKLGCTITGSGTMIRRLGGSYRKIRLVWLAEKICINTHQIQRLRLIRWEQHALH